MLINGIAFVAKYEAFAEIDYTSLAMA